TKTGLALLYDEHTSNTYDVRLKLTKELLIIQKQDVVCVNGGDSHLNGGAEHKVPVVISKIFKDQVADQTGMLFIGDAVLQVSVLGFCTLLFFTLLSGSRVRVRAAFPLHFNDASL
ncbi:Gamma-2-syntrophin, partial [Anabarilius grahami]